MNNKYKDKLVGVYAPGSYDHTSVLGQTQEFSKWFWANHEDMEYISAKLGINAKKLNRILTLEQLPDEELLKGMMELCEVIVYYDNMPDSEHIFSNKNDAINELHRLRGVKYRNSRIYTVEMVEMDD